MPRIIRTTIHPLKALAHTAIYVVLLSGTVALHAQSTFRTLTGTVVDRQHEPLAGAIVQLHDENADIITSYITSRTGRYVFKRLSSLDDYKVSATYKGHRSRSRSISKFDSKPNRDITLVINMN